MTKSTATLSTTAIATTALFRACASEGKAIIKTDTAIVSTGLAYATAIDTGAIGLTALMEEVAALPAAIKITETKARKDAGLPTNLSMLVGLAHVGRMVKATSTDGESRDDFDARRAWHLGTQIYSIGAAHGGGAEALSATLTDVATIEDAYDRLATLYTAVNNARIAAKAAAKAAAEDAANAANVGGEGSDDEGEGSGEGSEEPTSASRWASVLAVLAALSVAGLAAEDTAAHAQATALLAGMASFDVPATIEGVFTA